MEQLHALIGTQGEDINWWQMSIRACLVFVIGVVFVRLASTRAFGKWSALDIILAVVVGSNLGRAMTGNAPFVATLVATCVLLALHDLLIRASARWSWLSLITKGRSVQLVSDGAPNQAVMRRAGIGDRDLGLALRSAGHADLGEVRSVTLERNGDITVVPAREDGAS
jgi:uncharacterized membrane protein YcaP (DUF421 family)